MDYIEEEFTLTLKYLCKVDPTTGEMTSKCVSRTVDKSNFKLVEVGKKTVKPKVEESSEPRLILEDNRYCLNQAAVELMGIAPDCKLDIKYEKGGVPVIGTDEVFGTHSGNKLNKSLTVVCKGSKHDELIKHGYRFRIIPHNSKVGLFILQDLDSVEEEDELPVDIEVDTDLDTNLDKDLEDLLDDTTEIDSSLFKL